MDSIKTKVILMRAVIVLIILAITYGLEAQVEKAYAHLTYSQVGYDTGFPKTAMLRDTASDFVGSKANFILRRMADGKKMLSGKVEAPEEKWGEYWWKLDFSACDKPGEYFLEDGLHPNQAGHRIMANLALEMLRSLLD